MSRLALAASAIAVSTGLLACSEATVSGPTDGAIEITITTSGAELDPDGYVLRTDGPSGYQLGRLPLLANSPRGALRQATSNLFSTTWPTTALSRGQTPRT